MNMDSESFVEALRCPNGLIGVDSERGMSHAGVGTLIDT